MKKESLALVGAKILTRMDKNRAFDSILIDQGKVACVGTAAEIKQAADNRGIKQLNLKGKVLMPGPIDTHFHLLMTGLHRSSIDFSPCRSIDEILQLLSEHVKATEPKAWILGKGLDEFKLKEKRPPTAAELDPIAPQNPVFLEDRGIHYSVLNTPAIQDLRMPYNAPGVCRHPDGTLTGQFMEEIAGEVRHRLLKQLDEQSKRGLVFEAARYAASCGITSLHAIEGGEIYGDAEIPFLLKIKDELPVKISLHWNTFDLAAASQAGLRTIGGDIWLDGAFGSHTAALEEPYADAPEIFGDLYYSYEDIESLVSKCIESGIQVGFHAIGDRAIGQALKAFEAAAQKRPPPARLFRLDHFGLPSREHIRRASDLGVVISTQPTFPFLRGGPGSIYEQRLGSLRERRAYPLRELLDAGLLVAGASDSDVFPADIMLGVHSAVNHPYEEQRLSLDEAIGLYTVNAARIEFEEDVKGDLAVGRAGDLVVLDDNPFETKPERLRDIRVLMTVVDGDIVFDRFGRQ